MNSVREELSPENSTPVSPVRDSSTPANLETATSTPADSVSEASLGESTTPSRSAIESPSSTNAMAVLDESSLNRKRERAHSDESNDEQQDTEDIATTEVPAPKKTKPVDDDENTIRRSMKAMSTQDTTSSQQAEATKEEDRMDEEGKDVVSRFVGKNAGDDEWDEFAEESDDDTASNKDEEKNDAEKQKYTFGASSGFGTKSWSPATTSFGSSTSKQPVFGGFGSPSNFSGFKMVPTPSTSTQNQDRKGDKTSNNPSVVSFGSFGKATVSPLAALVSAAQSKDALSSSSQQAPPSAAKGSTSEAESDAGSKDINQNEEEPNQPKFGVSAKIKVPGVQPTEVKTGEEGEITVYQKNATLYILNAGEWKERGAGPFRINVNEDRQPSQARLVMRTDAVQKVILNLLLFKGMQVVAERKFVRFAGLETERKEDGSTEAKTVTYALKMKDADIAKETADRINEYIANYCQA